MSAKPIYLTESKPAAASQVSGTPNNAVFLMVLSGILLLIGAGVSFVVQQQKTAKALDHAQYLDRLNDDLHNSLRDYGHQYVPTNHAKEVRSDNVLTFFLAGCGVVSLVGAGIASSLER